MTLMEFRTEDLLGRLQSEFGYSERKARLIGQKLCSMNPEIRSAFWAWWTTGKEPDDLTVNGYSLTRLKRDFGCNPVAGFSLLDWMLREPDTAVAVLKRNDFVL